MKKKLSANQRYLKCPLIGENTVFIKGEFLYKLSTKLDSKIAQLHSMITHILVSWFKTFDSKQKTQKAQKEEKLVFQKKL